MRWPCDFNRPLSKEERAIAARLGRLTKEQAAEIRNPPPPSDWPFPHMTRRDFDRE